MKKLTKAQKAAVERIGSCGCVIRNEDGFMDVGGNAFHGRTIRHLIEKGVLVESGDALFDGCPSQSLRLSDA